MHKRFIFFQWKETDSGSLMDSKLKCVFVLPEDSESSAVRSSSSLNNGGTSSSAATAAAFAQPPQSMQMQSDTREYAGVREGISACEILSRMKDQCLRMNEHASANVQVICFAV